MQLMLNVDFSVDINESLIFSPGDFLIKTFVVRISQDGEIEQDENFTLTLSSDEPLTDLVYPNRTVVTILSPDGKSN